LALVIMIVSNLYSQENKLFQAQFKSGFDLPGNHKIAMLGGNRRCT